MCVVYHLQVFGYLNSMTLNASLLDAPITGKNYFGFHSSRGIQSYSLISSSLVFKLSKNGFYQLPVILFPITDWRITPTDNTRMLCKMAILVWENYYIEIVSFCFFVVLFLSQSSCLILIIPSPQNQHFQNSIHELRKGRRIARRSSLASRLLLLYWKTRENNA